MTARRGRGSTRRSRRRGVAGAVATPAPAGIAAAALLVSALVVVASRPGPSLAAPQLTQCDAFQAGDCPDGAVGGACRKSEPLCGAAMHDGKIDGYLECVTEYDGVNVDRAWKSFFERAEPRSHR